MVAAPSASPAPVRSPGLVPVLVVAAWLGLVGFGGGYAVLAQLRRLVVDRRRWLTPEQYADAVAVAQSLPGASGANFFTLLGLREGGVAGAALATALFLLPSALLMVAFGAFYEALRGVDRVEAIFAGMNPAVVAVIALVAWDLGRPLRKPWQIAAALASLVAVELGVGVFEVVLVAVVVGVAPALWRARATPRPPLLAVSPSLPLLVKMGLVFLRIGAATFGGGLAMIPVLDHQIVGTLHWLTPRELADAVTLGQITPGPVAITATFVGFRIAGPVGALAATVATFLPAFVATALVGRSIERFRHSEIVRALFAALAPAVAGIVGAAAIGLGMTVLHGWGDGAVALGAALLLVLRVPPLAVLASAAALRAGIVLFAG